VFRDDYVNALRALTRRHRAMPLVQALVKAHQFSHLTFSPYPAILKDLTRRNWFREPGRSPDHRRIASPALGASGPARSRRRSCHRRIPPEIR
jgi:hypothetical protein